MGQQIEALAQFVADTKWEEIPEPVQRHAKLVLLDTLGVILAGAERPEVRQLCDRLTPTAGTGATIFARGWPRSDPRTAALLNGIAGRSIELCEGLRFVSGQAAIQVLPGTLAVGEQSRSSGREMLAASCRLRCRRTAGRRVHAAPVAHQNGQVSLLAAAAAGARLHGLDGAGISRAMRIATTLLLTPSYTNAVAGATTLNVAGGMSGFAAALAPEWPSPALPRRRRDRGGLGELVGALSILKECCEELGVRWEITRNYFRLYACCNPIHPALDSCSGAAELRPEPEQIERSMSRPTVSPR